MPQQLSIKSKLVLILLTLSLTALAIMGYLSWRSSQAALFEVMQMHLASVRTAQAHQVERYFATLHSQIRTLAENEMTASATERLRQGFHALEQRPLTAEMDRAIEAYYTDIYLPALAGSAQGTPSYSTYRPIGRGERHLQYQYLAGTALEADVRPDEFETEVADSEIQGTTSDKKLNDVDAINVGAQRNIYQRWHQTYHTRFQNITKEFGYAALYLIDHETSQIIYTSRAGVALGSNLASGPYRQSNLARAVEAVQNNPERGVVQSVDFTPFRPALDEPAAFVTSAIYEDDQMDAQMVGIIAIQLSIENINALMPSATDWAEIGLGETGDSYLVGADMRMRSLSRYLQTSDQSDTLAMPSIIAPPGDEEVAAVVDPAAALSNSNVAILDGLVAGRTDTRWLSNYLGNDVLSAYAPLDVDGVDWSIVAEMDASEIMQPVYRQQRLFLITLATLALATSVLIILFAQLFVRPIARLTSSVQQAVSGELDTTIKMHGNNEFARLSERIQELVVQMRSQSEVAHDKDRSYEALLHILVPDTVAKQLHQNKESYNQSSATSPHGASQAAISQPVAPQIMRSESSGRQIVSRVQQVTVLIATLVDLESLNEEWAPDAVNQLLSDLASRLHEASRRFGLDAPLFHGDQVVAVCGLTTPRLDHAKRTVDFAQETMEILKRVNQRHRTQLRLQVGIHSGPMTAGVLGNQIGEGWFQYNMWGGTLNTATLLSRAVGPNVVVMSQTVYERVEQVHDLVEYRTIEAGGDSPITTWALATSLRMSQRQITLIQTTFAKLLPVADEVAEHFYQRLFELEPSLRSLFKSDLQEQRRKFMATLQVVISGLMSPEKIIPSARDLGRRHVGYGVRDEHYEVVGHALLDALAEGLHTDFTPDVREAWAEMYSRISSAMQMAAAEVEVRAMGR